MPKKSGTNPRSSKEGGLATANHNNSYLAVCVFMVLDAGTVFLFLLFFVFCYFYYKMITCGFINSVTFLNTIHLSPHLLYSFPAGINVIIIIHTCV